MKQVIVVTLLAALAAIATLAGASSLLLAQTAAPVQSNSALRDPKQAAAFKKLKACPATWKIQPSCPGYVVDHIEPLCAGGADSPDNMMYMTVEDAKKKDRVEMKLCRCMGTVR